MSPLRIDRNPDSAPAQPPTLHALAADSEPASAAAPPLHIEFTTTRVRADALAHLKRLPGVVQNDRAEPAETFRMLRNQVLQRLHAQGHNLLAITSPRRTAGKSLTALNLALTLAADRDSAVLLVDADLSGGGLQTMFGLPELPGLGEHLAHGVPLPALLVNPGIERLVLLPAGQGLGLNSAELLASRAAQQLVQDMRLRYADRIIVFDLPAVLDTADAVAFMPHVQTTLVVVEEHTSALADLERCRELLAPFQVIGTVMCPPPPPRTRRSRSDAHHLPAVTQHMLAGHTDEPDDPTVRWVRPPGPIESLSLAWRRWWQRRRGAP